MCLSIIFIVVFYSSVVLYLNTRKGFIYALGPVELGVGLIPNIITNKDVVYKPYKIGVGRTYNTSKVISTDSRLISLCDTVFFMKDWHKSKRCKIGYLITLAMNKEIIFEEHPDREILDNLNKKLI